MTGRLCDEERVTTVAVSWKHSGAGDCVMFDANLKQSVMTATGVHTIEEVCCVGGTSCTYFLSLLLL